MKNTANKLSVIIPAYNKDSEVFEVVSGYVSQLKNLRWDWEIIVVDDASGDQTLREALRSKKFNGNTQHIKVFSYDLNQGKGFALYYGFKKSCGDVIAFADADLDLSAKNLPILLEYFEKTKSDIAIGSKRHPLSRVSYPPVRRLMSVTYQAVVKILFNLDLSDTQVGVKVFRREVLESALPRVIVKKFAFDLELLVVSKLLGYRRIVEVPIELDYNFTSTISIRAIKEILVDTLAIFYRKKILKFYSDPRNIMARNELSINLQKSFI